jgi:potassium-transporting ATPase KdpC subunit
MFLKSLRTSVITVVLFTILTGVIYPFLVTGIAQLIFPGKANGSLLKKDGKLVGSELIGQPFSNPKYFWGRPSATSPFAYNAGATTGSNYGPLNPALADGAKKRIQDLRNADSLNLRPIPIDLVTASGSGLDPHISVSAALFQIGRVARTRNLSEAQIRAIVDQSTEGRQLGFLGESRVNVLKLNLALDDFQSTSEVK